VQAVHQCPGGLRVQLHEHGRLPGPVDERGHRARRVDALVAQPLLNGPLQLVGEPERLPVGIGEVRHAGLPQDQRLLTQDVVPASIPILRRATPLRNHT
jgi:hypothetical protein